MTAYFDALVTFSTNAQRTRARNAIEAWVTNWNTNNPNNLFTGSTTLTTYEGLRALNAAYQCPDYSGVEAAQIAIENDINANAYIDIISLGTRNF